VVLFSTLEVVIVDVLIGLRIEGRGYLLYNYPLFCIIERDILGVLVKRHKIKEIYFS